MKNMKIGTAIWVCLLLSFFFGTSAKAESITSPDGQLKLNFSVNMQGEPVYELSYKGKEVIKPSKLGLELKNDPGLMNGFTLADIKTSAFDETWEPVWGEVKSIRNHYNEMAVNLINEDQVQLTLRFRVFNDGVGFRYEYNVPNVDSLMITDELTTFHFRQDGTSWSIPASAETYELLYKQQPISEVETANTPFTFKTADGVYGSIHEAALYDFSEMTLKQIGDYTLKAELTPWPDGIKVRKSNHFTTSWRTIQIAPEAVGLINSSLILNLNDPCVLETTDWIRPLKYIGVWWGMHLGVETWKWMNATVLPLSMPKNISTSLLPII